MYILPYVKQMTSASSMHEAGYSKPVLWDNPEGWGGEGGGRGFKTGGHMYPNAHCSTVYNSQDMEAT